MEPPPYTVHCCPRCYVVHDCISFKSGSHETPAMDKAEDTLMAPINAPQPPVKIFGLSSLCLCIAPQPMVPKLVDREVKGVYSVLLSHTDLVKSDLLALESYKNTFLILSG